MFQFCTYEVFKGPPSMAVSGSGGVRLRITTYCRHLVICMRFWRVG